MKNKEEQEDFEMNELLQDLRKTKNLGKFLLPGPIKPTQAPTIEEQDLNQWIINKASYLVQQGLDASEIVKQAIGDRSDPEEVDAYSNLVKSTASVIDVLNKINIQNKKATSAKEIKQIDGEQKGQLQSGNVTNNILIATREEMMEQLLLQAMKPKEVIVKEEKE